MTGSVGGLSQEYISTGGWGLGMGISIIPSAPQEMTPQTPVSIPSRGLMQGTHFSPMSQMSGGSRAACAATWGMHTDKQRPGPPMDWHS